MSHIDQILTDQDGVISRRQAIAAGLTPSDIARALRRRTLSTVHTGVFVNHTGPLSWRQRAWAAVHACWPAALTGDSARRAHEGPGRRTHEDDRPIQIVIDHRRRVKPPAGVVVTRSRRFDELVQPNLAPPRMHRRDWLSSILADVAEESAEQCRRRERREARAMARRRSEAAWLAVDRRQRSQRACIAVRSRRDCSAASEGTCSVLEHGYLNRVERPHGLPRGLRQVPARDADQRSMFRDVLYGGNRPRWRQIVELDGRLGHDSVLARDLDMDRDLDAAVERSDTVRLGYGQVFVRACRTASQLAAVFGNHGWRGEPHACPECADGLFLPAASGLGNS